MLPHTSTMSVAGSTSCTACLTRSRSSARCTTRLLCYVVSLCYVCLSCEVLAHLLLSLLQLEQIWGSQGLIVERCVRDTSRCQETPEGLDVSLSLMELCVTGDHTVTATIGWSAPWQSWETNRQHGLYVFSPYHFSHPEHVGMVVEPTQVMLEDVKEMCRQVHRGKSRCHDRQAIQVTRSRFGRLTLLAVLWLPASLLYQTPR